VAADTGHSFASRAKTLKEARLARRGPVESRVPVQELCG
jgi:hypothetical protein